MSIGSDPSDHDLGDRRAASPLFGIVYFSARLAAQLVLNPVDGVS